ncbi:MAG TPA: PH domain-containing protein [Thermomicrobiales bacterium]|jgi:hypothetical protein|nr:PH domain-containing protein [Thermomicrobiales bacterium]
MATIYCPACGHENDVAAKFCENCGRSLADVAEMRSRAESTGTRPRRPGTGPSGGGPAPTGMPSGTSRDDRLLDDDGAPLASSQPPNEPLTDDSNGERVLWRGRPSKLWSPRMALMNRYRLTDQRLRWEYGFIARRVEEIELFRINDVAVKQGALERIVGISDITCYTSDTTSPHKVLHNIRDAETVKDLIRSAVRRERERRRVMVREDMYGTGDDL